MHTHARALLGFAAIAAITLLAAGGVSGAKRAQAAPIGTSVSRWQTS